MAVPAFVQSIGNVYEPMSCAPGADVWVSPGSSMMVSWYYAGPCAESGTVTAKLALLGNGQSIGSTLGCQTVPMPSHCAGAIAFQDTRVIGAISGGGGTVTSSGAAFEFTPEQQAETYSGMVVVFGLFLGLLAILAGGKSIKRLLGWHGHTGD